MIDNDNNSASLHEPLFCNSESQHLNASPEFPLKNPNRLDTCEESYLDLGLRHQAAGAKDKPFALLFYGHVVMVLYLALTRGLPLLMGQSSLPSSASEPLPTPSVTSSDIFLVMLPPLVAAVTAMGLSLLWLALLRTHAARLLHAVFRLSILILVTCVIMTLVVSFDKEVASDPLTAEGTTLWTLQLFREDPFQDSPGLRSEEEEVDPRLLEITSTTLSSSSRRHIVTLTTGLGLGILAATVALYYRRIAPRLPFAATTLTLATHVLATVPTLVLVALCALGLSGLYILVWSIAVVGVVLTPVDLSHSISSVTPPPTLSLALTRLSSENLTLFISLIGALCWTLCVLKNMVHVITAATVGTWWTHPLLPLHTVSHASRRACTTHFGSIALGSLVVAVLETAVLTLSMGRPSSPPSRLSRFGQRLVGPLSSHLSSLPSRRLLLHPTFVANACLTRLVKMLTRTLRYFNRWAYVQVALYGKDFSTASVDTVTLLAQRGWSGLVNDCLVSGVLSVGALVIGAVCGCVSTSVAHLVCQHSLVALSRPLYVSVLLTHFGLGFVLGFGVANLVASLVHSCVLTLYVCFALSPLTLATSHPEAFKALVSAWQTFHPTVLATSGPEYATLVL